VAARAAPGSFIVTAFKAYVEFPLKVESIQSDDDAE
jgi:hypothetical protein